MSPTASPHRRKNPLTGRWVLVSPQRSDRPWQGHSDLVIEDRPRHDPTCYLCPGNARAAGQRNPDYQSTFVFTNDFPALLPDPPDTATRHPSGNALFTNQATRGTCRVLCFHPRHDLTLAQMSDGERRAVVDAWIDQSLDLGRHYPWVQIFENRGALMGASNPHPHGQIWATEHLPDEPALEDVHQRDYLEREHTPLLLKYIALERAQRQRVVAESAHFIAVVPYWAVWPFEILLVPCRHVTRLDQLSEPECDDLAAILGQILSKYDNLFSAPFSYSMGWHGAPWDADPHHHWQVHAHFYPPLLRSATVRKFMVGFEMLAEAQRDITPERAAERLRAAPAIHHRARSGNQP